MLAGSVFNVVFVKPVRAHAFHVQISQTRLVHLRRFRSNASAVCTPCSVPWHPDDALHKMQQVHAHAFQSCHPYLPSAHPLVTMAKQHNASQQIDQSQWQRF